MLKGESAERQFAIQKDCLKIEPGLFFSACLLNEVPKLKSVRNESGNLRPYSTVFLIIILKMDLSEL